LFGRGKREAAAAEAARENERRALFEKLAQRPDTVCPFLGLVDDRVGYQPSATDAHRCYAFGDPAPLSSEQQERVCLQRGYGNCPRYLRGILVIPSEELEALRRPQPMPAPPPVVDSEPEERRRRRLPVAAAGILVLLLLIGAGVGYLATRPAPGVAIGTSSPTPGLQQTPTPAATPSRAPTSIPTPTLEPTPEAGDTFDHYEVSVAPGSYTLFVLGTDGTATAARSAGFDQYSFAEVKLVESPSRSWLVTNGDYTGYSYIADRSGPFRIRKVFLSPRGERRSVYIPDAER
jgi:hypothetical protein